MSNEDFIKLAGKIADGTANSQEIALYDACYETFQQDPQSWAEMQLNPKKLQKESLRSFWREVGKPRKTIRLWPRIAAAASIILCLSIGGYFLLNNQPAQQTARTLKNDIAPGGNKAILTLANGQKIVLAGAKNGILANQGNTRINNTAGGQLVYDASKSESDPTIYNTTTTPRGGQYRLTLADGTDVWLNAASSIKYPTAFNGKDRHVEITGEAYFEVAHNAAKPFKVSSGGQTVEVLGTHFNINAYKDEANITTTLLQGSVKVIRNGSKITTKLYPGQQSIFTVDQIKLSQADTEQAVAWKNGDFMFDTDIKSIMRQLARWYDVDVSYQGKVTNEEFMASIPRSKNISEVLKALQLTKRIHFKVEGRSVLVMP